MKELTQKVDRFLTEGTQLCVTYQNPHLFRKITGAKGSVHTHIQPYSVKQPWETQVKAFSPTSQVGRIGGRELKHQSEGFGHTWYNSISEGMQSFWYALDSVWSIPPVDMPYERSLKYNLEIDSVFYKFCFMSDAEISYLQKMILHQHLPIHKNLSAPTYGGWGGRAQIKIDRMK